MGNTFAREEPIDFSGEPELRHFNLLRCVGKGAFGKVRIVEKRDTRKLYALKYINKLQCIRMRAIQNIFRERAILEEICHPLIVNLRFAFQDDENMFFVIDLMMGGDLRYHLDRQGGFSELETKVMIAEVVSAISYLHSKKIVHRDLKPDNVLLDAEGHAHVTDFNIAVSYADRPSLKSHSGTHAYMAPEIFLDKGYLWQVDLWSIGILTYELLYGKRPFRGNSNEAVTQAIQSADLVFPSSNMINKKEVALSPEAINFIRALLERDVSKRLGCGPSEFEEVFAHPWFAGYNWKSVGDKGLNPYFVPDPNHSNFDATHDLEELLLEENPLTYRPRKKKAAPKSSAATPQRLPQGSPQGSQHSSHLNNNHNNLNNSLNGTPQQQLSASFASRPQAKSLNGPMSMTALAGPVHTKDMSSKEKLAVDLQFIDDNFKSFDYTVYEKYQGFADPTTMRASDPPNWAVDISRKSNGAPGSPSPPKGHSPPQSRTNVNIRPALTTQNVNPAQLQSGLSAFSSDFAMMGASAPASTGGGNHVNGAGSNLNAQRQRTVSSPQALRHNPSNKDLSSSTQSSSTASQEQHQQFQMQQGSNSGAATSAWNSMPGRWIPGSRSSAAGANASVAPSPLGSPSSSPAISRKETRSRATTGGATAPSDKSTPEAWAFDGGPAIVPSVTKDPSKSGKFKN